MDGRRPSSAFKVSRDCETTRTLIRWLRNCSSCSSRKEGEAFAAKTLRRSPSTPKDLLHLLRASLQFVDLPPTAT
jgi:hypothetical protein